MEQNTTNATVDGFYIDLEGVGTAYDFYTWTSDRIPMVSAHRGGPYPGFPENAIETFENVLNYTPSIIELDVAMTKDSVLVLMHDDDLDRTTNGTGKVEEVTYEYIQSLFWKMKMGS
ncbi:glycerophosphodiester phosphodiesterase family protein [Algoriphagus halophilus]|uniref:glycerophosphodiester phosphodiesterase family protein n=1 Tax=Algoriphagus halophilus TaxID=226505 RepID=UPI00358F0CAD